MIDMAVLEIISGIFSLTTLYLTVATIVIFFIYDFWTHTYFKRLGIPGPPPKPIFGNAMDFGRPIFEVLGEYSEKYGPVVGIYMFRRPVLVISDLDMLRNIMVKDFHNFYNKFPLPLGSGSLDTALFLLRDAQWKRVRDVITPSFTGKKMKMMSDIINECADMMVEKLHQSSEDGGNVETQELFGSFVMDALASCAFGLKVNSQKDKNDPFVKNAAKLFEIYFTSPVFMAVSFIPSLRPIFEFFNFTLFPKDVIDFFHDVTEKTVAMRESQPSEQGKDFLQLLIDAKNGKAKMVIENDDDDVHNKYFKDAGAEESVSTKTKKYLTKEELFGQSIIFLSAGYETTATLLTYASYLLASNPDCQDKLIAEIDDVVPKRDDVSYTSISKMPYLDQVVCEVLRIYPPGVLSDRECGETCTYNGCRIDKGIQIWIPTYSIQRDPNHWPDPLKFDPERFTKENREGRDPFTWMPFGAGPRICLGMRFALMEAKMALVRSLQEVRFEISPLTKIPPPVDNTSLMSKKDSYTLKVVQRN
ncbi:cytochrome P450 3A6-like [Lytechinus variegatus]|uniref:cytochrome P450 3A6-like n=1 Tax=Lytechinus variegatus TaxID=7654 RepID=UPI001BB11C0C|nr:cytochrome P450 3A6-like [Lytechinus variegatus]